MKNTKDNSIFIIGMLLLVIIFVAAYYYLSSDDDRATSTPVSCAIGDRFDVMTGKPCPILIEEDEPATSTKQ